MKPVKLSLSSTNEELLFTMKEEGKRVEYWHKKHYGGPSGYDKFQDVQLAKVQRLHAGGEIVDEMIDYHSLTTGNRWKSFEVTTCYGVGNAYTRMFRFCYWDTYGSVGAFYNCSSGDHKHNVLLVFPSHFFQRYAERMDVHYRDASLVCEFFNRNHGFAIDISLGADKEGRRQFIIASKEGACYGFARTKIETPEDLHGRDNVFEVRTFIRYEQMSKRQLKECERVRDMAEEVRISDGAPMIHTVGRMITDEAFSSDIEKRTAKHFGLTLEQFDTAYKVMLMIMRSADYVSGELSLSVMEFAKGEASAESQRDCCKLFGIAAEHVRQDSDIIKNLSTLKILLITHEWKGDDYDWNKWFWHILRMYKKDDSVPDSDKRKLEVLMDNCIKKAYSYEEICTQLSMMTE